MADTEPEVCASKANRFRQLESGKYECCLCRRRIVKKQNILLHLVNVHRLSPVKRVKKQCLHDDSIPVPYRTLARWKKTKETEGPSNNSSQPPLLLLNNNESCSRAVDVESPRENHLVTKEEEVCTETSGAASCGDTTHVSSFGSSSYIDSFAEGSVQENMLSIQDTMASDSESDSLLDEVEVDTDASAGTGNLSVVTPVSSESESEMHIDSDVTDVQLSDDSECVTYSCSSIGSSNTSASDSDSDSTSSCGLSDVGDSDSEVNHDSDTGKNVIKLTETESQALTILSCFLRNNLSAKACKDVLQTMKSLFSEFSDSKSASVLDYNSILEHTDKDPIKEKHYCVVCSQMFPDDANEFRCRKAGCVGLRYKGSLSSQLKPGRQPQQSFVLADTKRQLKSLLETPGIMDDIKNCKAGNRKRKGSGIITDITDGSAYHDIMQSFLSSNTDNLTAIFNTDGVNLYSSSKVELWPIFLAINELSPTLRFSRENMLLVGIWQGKGKPPFYQYMEVFSSEMNSLYSDGVDIAISNDKTINVKLAVVCGVLDLPAKAGVLNMTQYNGSEACIACEEPGIVVQQGKGHARCYPYRTKTERFPSRVHLQVIASMKSATDRKRCKGFKGCSGLESLELFNMVIGIVPDYMHGILLGITKTLMNKWFSPSESSKPYFIGKYLKEIARRMQMIKPPISIERLPRDLEKNYCHFKATELQAWLLYYALPCLSGLMEERFMKNLAHLSEATYILLGNHITQLHLQRAEFLLDAFYSAFEDLYGRGTCGLNVHNAGAHLVEYVRLWGPLWAWSCFPFEDANCNLLQGVHGTGIVLKQVMRMKQVQACLRRKGIDPEKSTRWKVKYEASNCDIAGGLRGLEEDKLEDVAELEISETTHLKKAARIVVNGKKFYSKHYSRLEKRVLSCHFVLYTSVGRIGSVRYFVLVEDSNYVYAVMDEYEKCESPLKTLLAGEHLVAVKKSNQAGLIPAEQLRETLVYISATVANQYIVKMPNSHGHAVFK